MSRRTAISLTIGVLLIVIWQIHLETTSETETSGSAAIDRAYESHTSGVMVSADGVVQRLLPDDNDGSRHQKFIVQIDGGLTLLMSHNIDLADRVPVEQGDVIIFRGQYEWSQKGGVVHWTHHDPDGRRSGGWIEHRGRRYR